MGDIVRANLNGYGFVEYEFKENSLIINSTLNVSDSNFVPKLYIYNSNLQKPFLLGSFYKEDGLYKFQKTYSMSYLDANNLLLDTDYFFDVYFSDSKIISVNSFENEDLSVKRAKELLNSLKDGKNHKNEVIMIISDIKEKIKKYEKCPLPFKSDFTFYKITDIKENFSLSSIEHIIYTQSFVRLFVKNDAWFFGVGKNEGEFCVCIKNNVDINPMETTKDCAIMITDKLNDEFYFLTGILVSQDGQYFYKIDHI